MNEKQIQRCVAYLELARTAIDNAELRLVGADESERPALAYVKACCEISVGAENLKLCVGEILAFAEAHTEKEPSASAVNGPTAGSTIPAGQKG